MLQAWPMTFLAHPSPLVALAFFENGAGADSGTRTLTGTAIILLVIAVVIFLANLMTRNAR
jgi:hypothetical protein